MENDRSNYLMSGLLSDLKEEQRNIYKKKGIAPAIGEIINHRDLAELCGLWIENSDTSSAWEFVSEPDMAEYLPILVSRYFLSKDERIKLQIKEDMANLVINNALWYAKSILNNMENNHEI